MVRNWKKPRNILNFDLVIKDFLLDRNNYSIVRETIYRNRGNLKISAKELNMPYKYFHKLLGVNNYDGPNLIDEARALRKDVTEERKENLKLLESDYIKDLMSSRMTITQFIRDLLSNPDALEKKWGDTFFYKTYQTEKGKEAMDRIVYSHIDRALSYSNDSIFAEKTETKEADQIENAPQIISNVNFDESNEIYRKIYSKDIVNKEKEEGKEKEEDKKGGDKKPETEDKKTVDK